MIFDKKDCVPTPPYNHKGFTLAETLIALVIIGVIAALTVPSLINKTQNQETVSKLKKAYSTFSQVTNSIIAEKGTPRASYGGWATTKDDIYEIYKKYLINAKDCGSVPGCFTQEYFKTLAGAKTGNWDTTEGYKKLVLSDGTQVIFENWIHADCNGDANGSTNWCARIFVDLNGSKKPNIVGRDVFGFVIKEKSLQPIGCDTYSCEGTYGFGCTCKILKEEAINY